MRTLVADRYETLMADVIDAKHIGRASDFRDVDTDWQLLYSGLLLSMK